MRLHVIEPAHAAFEADSCVVVCIYDEPEPNFGAVATERDRAALGRQLARGTVTGKSQDVHYLATPESAYGGVLVLGLGKPDTFDAEVMRRAAGKACDVLSRERHGHVVLDASSQDALPVEAFVEGIMLGQYDFTMFKKPAEDAPVTVQEIVVLGSAESDLEALRAGCGRTVLACQNANWARDLANTPANELTPRALAAAAQDVAGQVGCTCTIFDENQMRDLGMNAILGVGRGSAEPPRLIILEYRPDQFDRTLALVGKGVTFDTGGISLKQAPDMHEMKYDMCGAAAVLGALKTIAQAKPNVRVVCAVPSAENRPGPASYVPGDILRCFNGKTVEVHNTDAEGRLLLCDALAYVEKTYKPDAIVDVATLTGAMVVTLGNFGSGLFCNNERLAAELELASRATGERLWPLPLWDDYSKLIKGTHADLCNIGPRGVAGSITAACFLKEFIDHTPWAHIDIAGTAWDVDHIPYLNKKHATGFGVRLLSQWVLEESR
jgi:leucyl aminopeptidase